MSETQISKEIVITSHGNEVQVAVLEDKKLMEIHREKSSMQFSVGDIYLGKVKKIMPGLNAAFVDVGSDKEAFLHYLDLGVNARTVNAFVSQAVTTGKRSISRVQYLDEVPKNGRISDVITSGQQLMVQVAKEPISTKGPRVTTEVSFAGRYLVLVPFNDKVTISQKIRSGEERKRLKSLVQGIKPRNFGVIIRTNAEHHTAEELSADLDHLRYKWDTAVENLFASKPPVRVSQEEDCISSLLREMLNDSFQAIHVDTPDAFKEVKSFVHLYSPDKENIVKQYNDKQPIFERFGVAKQIKSSFGKVVTVRSGVYLIIEHTEAMHVIDVNSGNRVKSSQTPEENALNTNLIAAAEIARQLRLRDMGGIICIDFVDLHDAKNRLALYKAMEEFMANDKAKHTILPLNKFCVMQITRQRVRQATIIETTEQCPTCRGTGKVKPPILIEDDLANMLEFLFDKQGEKGATIMVHPFVAAYLKQGFPSILMKWRWKYKKRIKLVANHSYHLMEHHFFNLDNDEIMLWSDSTVKEETPQKNPKAKSKK
ncbi:MAG: Rne/Rng family ribonuclease [Bacteroidales bacterium]|nr:Rne/Rng family ribonuclease [Bacteroidales bacterium]